MLCDECKSRAASFHSVTKTADGTLIKRNLCDICRAALSGTPVPVFSALSGLLANFPALFSAAPKRRAEIVCSACGISSKTFFDTGYLGCGQCYTDFAELLTPVIEKLQYGTQHKGKSPHTAATAESSTQTEYERLVAELAHAVETENFEEAAVLRDRMRALKSDV
ncbi:MAG: UvrB/UvrC motif-containing protein [Firmicutes bacterium]|nr:UvrB/UvrC motif-containing protein [Bacillota bacterium]